MASELNDHYLDDRSDLAKNARVIYSTGMLVYAGPLTREHREELSNRWLSICLDEGIPVQGGFSLARVLSTPSEIRQWSLEGLPSDVGSIENAILVCNSAKCPLLIDPQEQGAHWFRNKELSRGFKEVSSSDPNVLRILSEAVTAGMTVLVKISEAATDPAMEALITKMVRNQLLFCFKLAILSV